MAVFDGDSQKIVVRVTYDGPSGSGKTTNLKKLGEHLPERRRSALVSPREEGGKTAMFDWMDVEGGLVGGHGLRCQLLSTPGRATLARRRRKLLGEADVVVFVTESTPEGLREGRRWMELLRASQAAGGRSPPLIVQANKQDRARSVDAAAVAAALGLDPSVPVVPARADQGTGVRETLVLAMRAAADVAQKLLLERTTAELTGPVETASSLLDVFDALDVEERRSRVASATSGIVDGVPARGGSRPYDTAYDPTLPHPDAPTGFIWPGNTGRDTLRRVNEAAAAGDLEVLRDDDDQGMVLRAGSWLLRTSGTRRFDDADEGRAGLLTVARAKTLLGKLLLPGSAVAVTSDADGGARLWTISPRTTTLREAIDAALGARDAAASSHALALWVDGIAEALVCATRQGLSFDLRPERFAAVAGDVAWIDEEDDAGVGLLALVASEVDRHAALPGASDRLLGALESQLSSRLSRADLERLAERGVFGRASEASPQVQGRIAASVPSLSFQAAVAS